MTKRQDDDKAKSTEPNTASNLVDENWCPGHIASDNDPKVCKWCGVHIDELRPPEEDDEIH